MGERVKTADIDKYIGKYMDRRIWMGRPTGRYSAQRKKAANVSERLKYVGAFESKNHS